MLNDLVTALSTTKVHLITNSPALTPESMDGATFTEVDHTAYSWYTSGGVSMTYGTAFQQQDGSLSVQVPTIQIPYGTSTSAALNVTGWYVTSSAISTIVAAGLFSSPQTMATSADSVVVTPVINNPLVSQSRL
jgi:hypothetical protein